MAGDSTSGNLLIDYIDLVKQSRGGALKISGSVVALLGGCASVIPLITGGVYPSELVLAARTGLGVSIIALGFLMGAVPMHRALKQLQFVRTPAAFFESCVREYGFQRELVEATAVLKLTGSFTERTKVRVSSAGAQVQELAHFGESGTTSKPQGNIGVSFKGYSYTQGEVVMLPPTVSSRTSEWRVKFHPAIQKDQNAEYDYEERCPKGSFVMSHAGVKALPMGYETWSVNIKYPTRRLTMTIYLPFKTDNYTADVWCDKGTVCNESELARVKRDRCCCDGITPEGKYFLTLKVDYPVIGLSYAIKWIPAARRK